MMKFTSTTFCIYFFAAILANAQLSNFHWAKDMGGPLLDEGNSLVVDSQGNVYVTGWFQGTAQFGSGVKTSTLISVGESDVFVAKLDKAGNLLWVKQMGGNLNEGGYSIAIDTFCNVYAAGYFKGTVDFNPNSGIYNLTSFGNYDIFITKLDSMGNFIWVKQMGGHSVDQLSSIVLDISGYIYIAGYFSGTSDFDPSDRTFSLTSVGSDSSYDIFITKLDPLGNFIWAKQMGGPAQDLLHSLTLDASGHIYAIGSFRGISDFDPGIDTFLLSSVVNRDIFVTKLDTSGNLIWAKQMGGTARDVGYSIKVDLSGNVYTTGSFEGTADFDPGPNVFNLTDDGLEGIFICKLDSLGNFIWAKHIGGNSSDCGLSLALDSDNNVYTTGWFSNTVDFDPGIKSYNLTAAGLEDIFISRLDSDGNFIWAKRMGGASDDMGFNVTVDLSGNVYSTGYFVNVGDFSLDNNFTYNLTSSGSHDVFIKKFSPSITIPRGNTFLTYPNPCNNLINIDFAKTIIRGKLIIYSILGQMIFENEEFNGDSFKIYIGNQPAGAYFIEVIDNELTYRAAFIKE